MSDVDRDKEKMILTDVSNIPSHSIELSKYVKVENLEFSEVLHICQKNKIEVTVYGKVVDPHWMDKINEMILEKRHVQIKKGQKLGIERALQKKYEGEGHYGRPKIILPDGFDERVKDCFKNNHPLSDYCEEIEMKKSTFYKYAKRVQEKVKIETNMKDE